MRKVKKEGGAKRTWKKKHASRSESEVQTLVSDPYMAAAGASDDERTPTPKPHRRGRRRYRYRKERASAPGSTAGRADEASMSDRTSYQDDRLPSAAAGASAAAAGASPATPPLQRESPSPEPCLQVKWDRPLDRAIHYFMRDNSVDLQPMPGSMWFTPEFTLKEATGTYMEGLERLRDELAGMPGTTPLLSGSGFRPGLQVVVGNVGGDVRRPGPARASGPGGPGRDGPAGRGRAPSPPTPSGFGIVKVPLSTRPERPSQTRSTRPVR